MRKTKFGARHHANAARRADVRLRPARSPLARAPGKSPRRVAVGCRAGAAGAPAARGRVVDADAPAPAGRKAAGLAHAAAAAGAGVVEVEVEVASGLPSIKHRGMPPKTQHPPVGMYSIELVACATTPGDRHADDLREAPGHGCGEQREPQEPFGTLRRRLVHDVVRRPSRHLPCSALDAPPLYADSTSVPANGAGW